MLPIEVAQVKEVNPFFELYEFEYHGEVLYLTNNSDPITIGGKEYKPAPITHTRVSTSQQATTSKVNIFIGITSFDFKGLINIAIDTFDEVKVTIKRFFPDKELVKTIFLGYVSSVEFKPEGLSLSVTAYIELKGRTLPRLFLQILCNNIFGDNLCGVSPGRYVAVYPANEVTLITPTQIRLPSPPNVANPLIEQELPLWEDFFKNGVLEFRGKGQRFVVDFNIGERIAVLNAPIPDYYLRTDVVKFYPQCPKTFQHCPKKDNFNGFPLLPTANPVLYGFMKINKGSLYGV